jgi:formamidopyrimidine-DNA glycosylase
MPELPEVETVCRLLRRVLVGGPIVRAEVEPDEIVLCGTPPEIVQAHLLGREVVSVGRRGKFFWLEFPEEPYVFAHLGMAGWIRELPRPGSKEEREFRLREHGNAPLYDENGRLRFQKLMLEGPRGERVGFSDSRRFARIWLGGKKDKRVAKLGPDALHELPDLETLKLRLGRKKSPIKAVLLDQAFLAGIGNWIADEVLYQARIAPARIAASLSAAEVGALREQILHVLSVAVEAEADYERFPEHWMFGHRWGGSRGSEAIEGRAIVRETIAGRTAAWVPEVQK